MDLIISQLPPLPLIDGCLFIDNSGWMEGMSTCPRYLEYKCLRKRVPTGEKTSLNFGSAMHMAMELRYVRYNNRPVDDAYYNDLSHMLTDYFEVHPAPTEDWRTINWAMEVARRYNDKYELEDFNLLKYTQPIPCPACKDNLEPECYFCKGARLRDMMVELPFAVPLYTHQLKEPIHQTQEGYGDKPITEVKVVYTGRIDLPNRRDGDLYIDDHKTTEMLGDMFWNEQRRSAQQKGYCWAFEQLTGEKVRGYEINAIRTKEPPQYVTAGKASPKTGAKLSPATWWSESFQRNRYVLNPGELDEWKMNTVDICEEFFWHYSRGYMPQKTKWCASYGKCVYFDVCNMVPEDRAFLLASGQYTDNIWSPLNQPSQPKQ